MVLSCKIKICPLKKTAIILLDNCRFFYFKLSFNILSMLYLFIKKFIDIFYGITMKKTTFIIGGCRSGKSSHALELSNNIAKNRKLFFATCVPLDSEMRKRVANHQKERASDWTTIEVPLNLSSAILKNSENADVMLIDCLTLWTSNLLMEYNNEKKICDSVEKFINALTQITCPVFIVSNEVGMGIVPENRLARQFRDIAGFVNHKVAAYSDRVILMVAGIPVTAK